MEELKFLVELIRSLGPFFSAPVSLILLIVILKKFVFTGWGGFIKTTTADYFAVERKRVRAQTKTNGALNDLGRQLGELTKKFSEEIRSVHERITTVERVFSDHIDQIRELKDALDAKPCLIEEKAP